MIFQCYGLISSKIFNNIAIIFIILILKKLPLKNGFIITKISQN